MEILKVLKFLKEESKVNPNLQRVYKQVKIFFIISSISLFILVPLITYIVLKKVLYDWRFKLIVAFVVIFVGLIFQIFYYLVNPKVDVKNIKEFLYKSEEDFEKTERNLLSVFEIYFTIANIAFLVWLLYIK